MTETHPKADYAVTMGVLTLFFPLFGPVLWWQTHHILRDMDALRASLAESASRRVV